MTYSLLVLFSIILGALVGYAPLPTVALVGLLFGVAVLFLLRDRLAIWISIVICYVLVGPAESIARIPKVFWISYLLGLFLFAKAILAWMGPRPLADPKFGRGKLSSVTIFFSLFGAIALFSSLAARVNIFQFLLSSRDYLWLWGFFALVIASRIDLSEQTNWLRFLPWVVVLQVPLTIYQRFFLSASHHGATRDAVVGLFGGNPEGGGASGAMGFFSLLMALYTITRMRNGCTGRWTTLVVVVSALICIALAEVKFVALVAPLVAIAFFGIKSILKSAKTIIWIVVFVAAGPAILYGYWKTFEAPGAKGMASFDGYLTVIVDRNIDANDIDFKTGEMGRISAIRFWGLENNIFQNPLGTLLGHGIGASRIGMFQGEIAKKYRFNVARSSLAVLLWETGLLGAGCVLALLLIGWKRAKNLLKVIPDSYGEERAAIQLTLALFSVAILGLIYNTDLVGTPTFQLLIVLCVAALLSGNKQYRNFKITTRGDRL